MENLAGVWTITNTYPVSATEESLQNGPCIFYAFVFLRINFQRFHDELEGPFDMPRRRIKSREICEVIFELCKNWVEKSDREDPMDVMRAVIWDGTLTHLVFKCTNPSPEGRRRIPIANGFEIFILVSTFDQG